MALRTLLYEERVGTNIRAEIAREEAQAADSQAHIARMTQP